LTVEAVGKLRRHWGKLEVEYQNQPQRWTDARRVRKLLDDFYQQVAIDTQLQSISHRLFSQVFYNYGLNHGPGLNCQGEDSHE